MLLLIFLLVSIHNPEVADAASLKYCDLRTLPTEIQTEASKGSAVQVPSGTDLKVRCREKYREGTHSTTCQNGLWTKVVPACQLVDCGVPEHPEGLYMKMPCRWYNCTATYTCDEGFWYNGTLPRVCQRDETWTGTVGTCKAILCPELPDPGNGTMLQGNMSYKAKASVVCDEGYIYSKPNLNGRECQGDNTWTPQEGECEAVQCPLLLDAKHGVIDQPSRKYLANVTISCNEGFIYSRPDSRVRQCQGNNTWSGQEGVCEGVRCPTLPKIEHGEVLPDSGRYNESAMLQCESGFNLKGPGTVTCGADGQWSTTLGSCEKISSRDAVVPIVIPILVIIVIIIAGILFWFCYLKPKRDRHDKCCLEEMRLKLLADEPTIHCSFTLTGNCISKSPDRYMFESLIKSQVLRTIEKQLDITVRVDKVVLCQNDRVFIDICCAQDLSEETVNDALNEMVIKHGKCFYHVIPESFMFRERAIHYLMADIHTKRHLPDKKHDRHIDLDTQYVKLKLQSYKTLGAMHRDTLEERPDLYQQGMEKHEGKDIEDENLIEDEDMGKYILIRGRAGIGKSTLLQRLLWNWANGRWGSQFKAIFMVNLRFLMTIETHIDIDLPRLLSLYSVYNTGSSDIVVNVDWLEKNETNIGLILDGIDEITNFRETWGTEFKPKEMQDSLRPLEWCFSLLKREVMKKSTLIVSSRPIADLRVFGSSKTSKLKIIELMGLTREHVMEFVKRNVPQDKRRAVRDKLERNPILLSVCAITFYCAALCDVLSEEGDMPLRLKTYTQITAYIMQTYMRRSTQNGGRPTLTDFYESVKDTLQILARVAADGLLTHGEYLHPRLMFDEKDFVNLKDKQTTHDMEKIGLLMETEVPNPEKSDETKTLSQFVHLSIQEFLAMVGLLDETPQQVKTTLNRLCKSGQFNMAFLFLYGLAFNEEFGPVRNISAAVSSHPATRKEVKDILLNGVEHIPVEKALQALQIAHESQSKDVVKEVARTKFDKEVSLKNTKLTVVDILAMSFLFDHHPSTECIKLHQVGLDMISIQEIAHCLEKCGNIKKLQLIDDGIDDRCVAELMDKTQENKSLSTLGLTSDQVTDRSMDVIASTISTNKTLQSLSLSFRKVTDSGVKAFADALKFNGTLLELSLTFLSMTDQAVQHIAEAVVKVKSLKMLSLHTEDITNNAIKHIFAAAKNNGALKDLKIESSCLTDAGLVQAADSLKKIKTLEVVSLTGFQLQNEGVTAVLDILMTNRHLTVRIWAPSCNADLYSKVTQNERIVCIPLNSR